MQNISTGLLIVAAVCLVVVLFKMFFKKGGSEL